ncbi:signal transduction histidine kinase [Mycolicibacterium sp. BK556]|uniref:ATP-binding protein n=1 Tax=Mycobacteriaceae TaxID=1762 RepID=UPI00105EFF93|nr:MULTISPECIES: ATP-binding protein [Mycobacteriaceae]MBB3601398.1 signal transduction histidine kinase [Mycolicibacterium sp. BK556]MBB3631150.1 signal transduction histidine kinase [Mycolicibacterium sp. BK607]MBB3749152.1 signal transduction histidine kinase [Mycolicibacterium sp. BK634]TDO14637.1 signal transduction histidine kinase [Mycobacterium sp. BK086]
MTPTRDRLLALLIRPTPPPLVWGVLTAIAFIAAETAIVHLLKRVAPDNAFGAIFLLGVLVVSAGWGFGLAVATSVASAMAYVWFHVNEGTGSLIPAVVVFLTLAVLTNVLVGQARLRAAEAMRISAELQASRARIVSAADQARRGFERDLHDGAQQRIVSLGLELRALEASVPEELPELRAQLGAIIEGLAQLHTDLQELSRGIHPAILSRGGLGPAIKTLARRSAVPVALDLDVDRRLPESVEVAAYYVVAEALTNAAKHAQADEVTVWARVTDTELALRIADDGIGGAGHGGGSGLIGLKDRVEALSGRLGIVSATGAGTTISVNIPLPSGG